MNESKLFRIEYSHLNFISTMAFFSFEGNPFKSWMVANMKIWGFIPALLVWFLATFIVAKLTPDADVTLSTYCLIAAITSAMIFGMAQENQAPMVIYTLILACPFILLIGHAMGKFDLAFLTTGVVVFLWIDIVLSLAIGGVIAYYAYQNADDVFSRLFYFRSSMADILSGEFTMTYMRFVEAFLFSFIGLASFAPLFS